MDYTPIFNAIIALLGAILTAWLIPFIKAHTTAAQHELIKSWVKVAVSAAEQTLTTATGKEKKAYVLEFLKEKGISQIGRAHV